MCNSCGERAFAVAVLNPARIAGRPLFFFRAPFNCGLPEVREACNYVLKHLPIHSASIYKTPRGAHVFGYDFFTKKEYEGVKAFYPTIPYIEQAWVRKFSIAGRRRNIDAVRLCGKWGEENYWIEDMIGTGKLREIKGIKTEELEILASKLRGLVEMMHRIPAQHVWRCKDG